MKKTIATLLVSLLCLGSLIGCSSWEEIFTLTKDGEYDATLQQQVYVLRNNTNSTYEISVVAQCEDTGTNKKWTYERQIGTIGPNEEIQFALRFSDMQESAPTENLVWASQIVKEIKYTEK